jgi:DNA (cytosine-5)-methyltransferase 1
MEVVMTGYLSASNFADIMGVSRATVQKWEANGIYQSVTDDNGKVFFSIESLKDVPEIKSMIETDWEKEMKTVPRRDFTSVELFAGAGGLALGMEKAGFKHVLLNEFNHTACNTLRLNRPEWNVVEGDVHDVSFEPLRDKVDFLSGGFPCQAFSYAGNKGGFSDTRGTLFFEMARAINEIRPKVFMGENVKGLWSHDNGRTLQTIRNTIAELGYTLVEPRVLKAIMYQVPQKRERLILIAIRNDFAELVKFRWPSPYNRIMTLRDAFYKGILYDTDVPQSEGATYPEKKRKVMAQVPMGGDWRDLPEDVQKDYMGGSYYLEGGKTGMARRLSLDEPSLTLTCAPAQKQTERCHPIETRPLSVREYARIQTFPDDWQFCGANADKYKQIGNAVPVNLAWAVGRSLIRLFNELDILRPDFISFDEANCIGHEMIPSLLF